MKATNKLGTLIGSLVLASAITMLIPSLSVAKGAHHSKASKRHHHSKRKPVGKVCGVIFEDSNGNGKFNRRTDDRLANIILNITDSRGKVTTVQTNKKGHYCARGIARGEAIVDVDETTLPAGATQVVGTDSSTVTVKAYRKNWAGRDGYTFTQLIGYETIEYNGQQWLDRNLGADEACISTFVAGTDACMGDYYQWGRSADGHEDINSELTDVLSSSSNPGHNEFIITDNVGTLNWIDNNEVDLWQEPGNANNGVCPAGWRVPTKSEFEALNITDSLDAFTKIKLHHSGYRDDEDGHVKHSNQHINGFYWTSTVEGEMSIGFRINNAAVSTYFNDWGRANGFQIRCIKH